MLNIVFIVGMVLFAISSAYFFFLGRGKKDLNSAFLVSFLTLVSYLVMWQGKLTVTTQAGEPIFWSRWLFYGATCTLLIAEIAKLNGTKGEKLVELLYLTVIVMFTGFLAARDLTSIRWIFFTISSVAYVLLVIQVLPVKVKKVQWVTPYILFGWTVFPIVFLLEPTGLGLIGAALANLLYLALDIYTKIVFNIQLSSRS
jgi:sensory rhodopsin